MNDEIGFDIPDIPMIDPESGGGRIVKDKCDGAFRFAFIGLGQAGNRIVEAFWNCGYRRVCAVNTTSQDMNAIDIPAKNKLVMDVGTGGAGKNPEQGREAAQRYADEIYDLMKRSFGEEVDKIFVVAGAGGGTGTGGFSTVFQLARKMLPETVYGDSGVGAILSLPKVSEGNKVNANAYVLLQEVMQLVGRGRGKMDHRVLTPLFLIDNERVEKAIPNVPVSQFWKTSNSFISGTLHLFNSLAAKDSDIVTFDKADFQDILSSGIVTLGACRIPRLKDATDVSQGLRDGLRGSLLVGGLQTSNSANVGCIFVGGKEVMDTLPQSHLEYSFEMLTRHLKSGGVLHRGIYQGSKEGLAAYVILGELDQPQVRLRELAVAGGLVR